MSNTLECFDLYLRKLKWPIIAIRPKSKRPASARWQSRGQYQPWRHRQYVEKVPDANIGLLLGKIVDVEADTPEANELLENLLADYPHMRYASHKSVHHLFINPYKNMTRVVVDGVEFRANNHQSLLPPSTHPSGAKYRWLRPTTWELTELPDQLRKLCNSRRAKKISAANLMNMRCCKCPKELSLPIPLVMVEIEIFKMLGQRWQCRQCRTVDLREARRLYRRNKMEEVVESVK